MNVAMRRRALPMLLALALFVACSGRTGVISGELVAVGGPANVRQPLPGTVRISGEGHEFTYRVLPSADGSFSVEVPAGTYVVTGRSPLYEGGRVDCRMAQPSLMVGAGDTVTVDLACDMK
jgi:hypothetical protein